MSISYDTIHQSRVSPTAISPVLQSLKGLNEAFQQEGLNVLNEGFSEVATNQHFYNDYVQRLSEGLEPETASQFSVMANNARTVILQESIAGVAPLTALSLPMMRVAFPKTSIREGLPTEPVLQPKFKVTWFKPYIKDTDGTKQYLPASVKTKQSLFKLPQIMVGEDGMPSAIAIPDNGLINYDLLTPTAHNSALGEEIDPVFAIIEVTVKVGSASVAVPVDLRLDTNTNVIEGQVTAVSGANSATVRVFAKVDRIKGLMDVIALNGTVESIKIQGYITSEANNSATQVGFDIASEDIVIGTGQPIESPINIQQMTDTMAMYNIDTTVRHLEIMSTTLAQSTDLQGIAFLQQQFQLSPNHHQDTFNVNPPANYTLGPTAWREEIKIKIDKLVTRLMQETNFTAGSAVIFANPLDAQVLHNVRWTYSAEETPNGVNIEYKVGMYQSGITSYKVLSSFNFAPGEFIIVFFPNQPDQSTYKYYPYSFNVIRGSASPNMPNIPSIQMIKRHIFKGYTHMIAKLRLTE